MRNIAKWETMPGGAQIALTKDNVYVGVLIPIHMLPRRSRRHVATR